MYKYLMFKSIADAYFGFKNAAAPLFRCEEDCIISQYYVTKFFSLIFYFYMGHVCEFLSMFYEVAANFDRYFIISQKFKIQNSVRFYRVLMVCTMVFTFSLFIYVLLEQNIYVRDRFWGQNKTAELIANSTYAYQHYYVLRYNRLHWSPIGVVLQKIGTITRDGILVAVLLIVDILTVVKLRQSMKSKRQLIMQNPSADRYNFHQQIQGWKGPIIFCLYQFW